MFSKTKDYLSKPITWGGYLKLCGVSGAICLVYCGWMIYQIKKEFGEI